MWERSSSQQAAHLQKVGELGVAVGDVCGLGGERCKDVTQAAQGLVDGAGLLGSLALRLGPVQPLTAGQSTTSISIPPTNLCATVKIRAQIGGSQTLVLILKL